jgi:type II secretory pathway component PulM
MLWKKIWSDRLGREVSLVLLAKLVLLMLVWWAFFSDPIDQNLDHKAVAEALTTTHASTKSQVRHD